MQFKATFEKPRIDVRAWMTLVNEEMQSLLERALVAWLNAATAPIPAWSGASLGTFSEFANLVDFQLNIQPTALGSKLGLGTSFGATHGTGSIDKRRGVFTATYSTSLEHLIFNEFNNANSGGDPKVFSRLRHPGPYGFLEKGAAAFRQVTEQGELPAPIIKVTKVEIR